jgi:rhamnulokinase
MSHSAAQPVTIPSQAATHYLACDLGAESGRLMLGTFANGRIALEELHRFPNTPLKAGGSLHWNIGALFAELKAGLKKAAARNVPVASISTDSWGVDYALFDANGAMMPPVFHYRDPRTAHGVERTQSLVPWENIFGETGIQHMPLNTLYQLAAEAPERLRGAHQLLMIGDAFNFLLGGAPRAEESLASTSQFYNPRTKAWSRPLLDAIGVPAALLPDLVPSGAKLGVLNADLARESGLPQIEVIATCSHDTGAAVAAVPASGADWAYLSSGTWSLMGVELPEPLINDQARRLNFTNEIGFGSSVRLLKNIIGLWIIQECRREWARAGQEFEYATLTRLASEARPFAALINPGDARFLPPGDMPEKIASFCRETGQTPPGTPGETVRCVLESLALLYRRTLESIQELTGRKINRLHIVGGGSRNDLLNQFAASALQIPVVAGPVEATALGNVLIQAIALGHLPSLAAARAVVKESFAVTEFKPCDAAVWTAANERFKALLARQN